MSEFDEYYEWMMDKLREQKPYPEDESSLEYRQRLNKDMEISREVARGLKTS